MKSLLKRSAGIALAIATVALVNAAEPQSSHDTALNRNLSTFNALVKQLELNYVDSIRTDDAFQAAIYALLSTVDPYTEYYTAKNAEQFSTMTTGDYGGIGSYIMERDGWVHISEPYKDSPALKYGLKGGDRIIMIDSIDLKGKKSADVSALLKGTPGTTVKVTVDRPYVTDSILTFEIVREKLHMPSVPYSGILPSGIGYLRLTSFMESSADEVKSALENFKEQGVKGIILDLRGNGGGLLTAAVDIVGNFVPKGTEVLTTKGKDPTMKKSYKTPRSPILPDMPLVILIDGSSASASEITAGSLQDLDRAVLLGKRSFGKGLVQSTFPLPYDEMMKVTTAKYYIPSGRLIQALDYSRRNEDGSVARVPDSLTNVFHTKGGREVRDGGGLQPDITTEPKKYSDLLLSLANDFWVYDFITKYSVTHPQLPSPEDFEVTDEIFTEFKTFVDPDKFKYEKTSDILLKKLRESAESEGYLTDEAKEALDIFQQQISPDLAADMEKNRKEIEEYLGTQMMSRYYFDAGEAIQSLKSDEEVAKAVEILLDPSRYRSLLSK